MYVQIIIVTIIAYNNNKPNNNNNNFIEQTGIPVTLYNTDRDSCYHDWDFSDIFLVPPSNFWDRTSIRSQLIHSKSFSIDYLPLRLPLDTSEQFMIIQETKLTFAWDLRPRTQSRNSKYSTASVGTEVGL
jgi:hypothetical protein